MAASPWPIPEVSTSTRSNSATLQAAITSGRLFEISLSAPRVASGSIDAPTPEGRTLADFFCDPPPPAPAQHLDVLPASLPQEVDHVLEVLDVAALVGGDRDALDVFLQRSGHDFVHRAVVPQMDHFGAARLQDAAHDVDGGVVAVEKRRRRHEADLVLRFVFGVPGGTQIGHGCPRRPDLGWRMGRLLYAYVNVKLVSPFRHSLSPSLGAAVHPAKSPRGAASTR